MAAQYLPLALGLAVISSTNVAIHHNIIDQYQTRDLEDVITKHYKTALYSPILLDINLIKQINQKPISLAEASKVTP